MTKRLFTNSIFAFILLAIVFIDLINGAIKITQSYGTLSIAILRWLDFAACLTAFISFFVITKHSLSVIRLYIIFKIFLSAYVILNGVLDIVLYSYNRLTLETYFIHGFSVFLGTLLFFFFKKYRITRKEKV